MAKKPTQEEDYLTRIIISLLILATIAFLVAKRHQDDQVPVPSAHSYQETVAVADVMEYFGAH